MHFDSNIDFSVPFQVARLIDHTILKADATREDIRQVCAEARKYEFASVCVNSCWVPLVAESLKGSIVKVCSVAGFPLGAMSPSAKVAEVLTAVEDGANEIDMVINVGALRGGEASIVEDDIRWIVDASHSRNAIVKVIIETALLTDEQKISACDIAASAKADFVKTSTGFSKSGATVADVALMRKTVGPKMGVKASGGIRTLDEVRAMVAAGATRIGASAGVSIIQTVEGSGQTAQVPSGY